MGLVLGPQKKEWISEDLLHLLSLSVFKKASRNKKKNPSSLILSLQEGSREKKKKKEATDHPPYKFP